MLVEVWREGRRHSEDEEETPRLTRIAIGMGITKLRITGGEPLVRRDVLFLCESNSQCRAARTIHRTRPAGIEPSRKENCHGACASEC